MATGAADYGGKYWAWDDLIDTFEDGVRPAPDPNGLDDWTWCGEERPKRSKMPWNNWRGVFGTTGT